VLATIGLALPIPRLRIDASSESFMLEKDPARQFYEQAKQRFGSDTLTVIVVKAEDVLTPPALNAVKRLTGELERIPGVTRVESVTTVKNIKGEGDRLDTEPLVPTIVPEDPATLARIRRDALCSRIFVGNIVAADGRATAITVYTDPPRDDRDFDARFTAAVDKLIEGERRPGLSMYQMGGIFTKVESKRYLAADQARIIPIGTAVLLGTLWLAFRTPQGVVIPFSTAALSIVWTLGLLALLRIPMNLLTSIVPSLLLAIGFTEDVHMITEYHERLERGLPKLDALRDVLAETAFPLFITTLTTVVGFATLALTNITMLVEFGYAASLGLIANFIVTMLLLPIGLRYWPVPRRLRRSAFAEGVTHGRMARFLQWLGEFNLRHRVAIMVVAGVVAVLSVAVWFSLRVDNDEVSFFPRHSPVRERIADLQRSLGGAFSFSIVVDTGRNDGLKDPFVMQKIAGLQDFLAATGRVAKTVSVVDYVRKLNRELHGGDPAFEVVPGTADELAQHLLVLEGRELAKFIDFNASGANIVLRHNLSGSGQLSELRREIEAYVAREFPRTLSVHVTGEQILTNNAVDFMAVNEVQSLLSSFVAIALIHAVMFMSIKAGLLSMIPNVIPALTVYGLMGALEIPLNISTALIATIAIGIAVDDTVHHMVTYSRQLREHGDERIAMFKTLQMQGRPIIYVSLALVAGFLSSVFASLASLVEFGYLAAFVMLMALVAELTLAPVVMYSARLVTLWDILLVKLNPELVRQAPLFAGLSRWEARKVVLLANLGTVPAGSMMIRKGETATDMFLIVSGRLRVFDGERVLAVLGPGATVGEMALVSREVRSANVVAEEDSVVLRLDFAAFERIRRRFPYTGAKLFRNLARVLAERLRRLTETVVGDPAAHPMLTWEA